ncbi:hypothetical protein FO519_009937, partial [Halicephalobus sp. NKZ332]
LAMFSYHRKFVKNFAQKSAPLFDLLQKGREVEKEWTEEHTEIMEMLKTAITTAPALIIPNLKEPFTLETDGSKEGIGAALMQEQNGVLHPVAYFSRKTNKFEKNYSAAELETLAVVAAVEYFKHYIVNNGITTVITDSTNACSLMKRPANEGRMGRFQIALFPYRLMFKHRSGKMNSMCDHLSRYPEPERKSPEPEENILFAELRSGRKPHTTLEEIKEEQMKEYSWLFQIILTNTGWPTNYRETEKLKEEVQHFWIRQGAIYRSNLEEHPRDRLLIPYTLRERIITEYHSDPIFGGHMGFEKLIPKLKARAWWPNMNTDIANVIRALFGVPESIVTDNHKSLIGRAFKELETNYGIKHTTTCPYNPAANGMVERSNKMIMDGLRQNADARTWHLLVRPTMLAINSTICRSTHTSPFYLVFGRDPVLPIDNFWRTNGANGPFEPHRQAGRMRISWMIAKRIATENMQINAERATNAKNANDKALRVGELVMFRQYTSKDKLDNKWIGPFRAIGIKQPNAVITPVNNPITLKTVRVDRLKHFHGPVTLPLRSLRDHTESPKI